MPDLLTHYIVSLIVSSRVFRGYRAVLIALIGLLPDVDAVLGWHRSPTHSLLAIAAITLACTLATRMLRGDMLRDALRLTPLLYALHVAMDVFNAPAPLFWPLDNHEYMISLEVYAESPSGRLPAIKPALKIIATRIGAPHGIVEGPLVSNTGVILILLAIGVYTASLVAKKPRQ